MKLRSQTKLGLGAALATIGALLIVLTLILGWADAARPWSFVLGFLIGVMTGIGAVLSIAGLLERRQG